MPTLPLDCVMMEFSTLVPVVNTGTVPEAPPFVVVTLLGLAPLIVPCHELIELEVQPLSVAWARMYSVELTPIAVVYVVAGLQLFEVSIQYKTVEPAGPLTATLVAPPV